MPVSCGSVAVMRGLALGAPAELPTVPLFDPGEPALGLSRPLLLGWRLASALPGLTLLDPPVPIDPAALPEPMEPEPPIAVEPAVAVCAMRLHASKSACVAVCAVAAPAIIRSPAAPRAAAVARVKLAITASACPWVADRCRRRTATSFKANATERLRRSL